MAAPASRLDALVLLNKPTWRDVAFEVASNDFEFDHQHAQHLYPDRDAGYIEATGRNPARYRFTALFRNGIAGEGTLYPDRWRLFIAACLDRSSGPLKHPELGVLTVKCQRCRSSWNPEARDGCDVDVEFVECSDTEDELVNILGQTSPAAAAAGDATDIENALGDLDPEPELPTSLQPSLLSTIKQLNGAFAEAKLSAANLRGQVDQITDALGQLHDNIASADDPKNCALLAAILSLGVHVGDLLLTRVAKGRPVTQVEVTQTATLVAVASAFHQSTEDLLNLNPALGAHTRVTAGQQVFVYV